MAGAQSRVLSGRASKSTVKPIEPPSRGGFRVLFQKVQKDRRKENIRQIRYFSAVDRWPRYGKRLIILSVYALLFLAWFLTTDVFHLVPSLALPSPSDVWDASSQIYHSTDLMFSQYTFFEHYAISLARLVTGFCLGGVLGVLMGIFAGVSRICGAVFEAIFKPLYSVPEMLYIILLLIWVGVGTPTVIYMITVTTMLTVARATTRYFLFEADQKLVETAIAFNFSRVGVVRSVVLPLGVSSIFTGLELALGRSFGSLIFAEWIAGRGTGLGFLAQTAAMRLDTAFAFVLIAIVLVTVFVCFGLLRLLEWILAPRYR